MYSRMTEFSAKIKTAIRGTLIDQIISKNASMRLLAKPQAEKLQSIKLCRGISSGGIVDTAEKAVRTIWDM